MKGVMMNSIVVATRQPRSGRRASAWVLAIAALAVLASLAHPAAAAPQAGMGDQMGGMHGVADGMAGPMGDRMGGPMGGEMGGEMGGGMGEGLGGGMMMGGRHAERALDSVGASAEQKAQLRQIMDTARAEMRPLREAARGLHRQMQQLFAQPTVDARAAEALRQQLQANREQASKRMLQAMLDASRVLSPEQRKQLADRMEQRRNLMQRQRTEREALEGAPRRP